MAKRHNDQYWMDLITRCRASGLTDHEWCRQNNISPSTFYYHIKVLREKACSLPASRVASVPARQDVVQVFVAPDKKIHLYLWVRKFLPEQLRYV